MASETGDVTIRRTKLVPAHLLSTEERKAEIERIVRRRLAEALERAFGEKP